MNKSATISVAIYLCFRPWTCLDFVDTLEPHFFEAQSDPVGVRAGMCATNPYVSVSSAEVSEI